MIRIDIKSWASLIVSAIASPGMATARAAPEALAGSSFTPASITISAWPSARSARARGGNAPLAFLKAAVAWYKRLRIKIESVMTNNQSCYRSKVFNKLCEIMGIRHVYTQPYTFKTKGKAERFIPSSLSEWAYTQAYDTSEQRKKELPYWLYHYNWNRTYAGIKRKLKISRSGLHANNLLRDHN